MAVKSLFWTLAAALAVANGQAEHSVCEVSEISLYPNTTALLYSPSSGDNVTSKCTVRVTNSEHSHRIIQLDVTSFSLGGQEPCSINQEYLQISFPYSGRGDVDTIRWCGQSYSPRLETREVMDITYFPGPQAERGPGFNITIATDTRFHCGGRELMVGDQPMFLYSPGYPAPYDRNMSDCKWEVQSKDSSSLLVDTQRFSVEGFSGCDHDYVQIDSAKHCGYQRVRFISKTSRLELQFVTNNLTEEDGFIFKFIESPSSFVASCGTEVVADNVPRLLQLPINYGEISNKDCGWLVDSGSSDSVVLLEMNNNVSAALCGDYNISIYDGMNSTLENRILWVCSNPIMIHNIRSSSRYLYIEASLSSTGQSQVNVSFTYSSSRRRTGKVEQQGRGVGTALTKLAQEKDSPPRVLYANFNMSYVWLDLDAGLDLGLLIQGVESYSSCIQLNFMDRINASEVIYAFSGWNESFAELTTACGRQDSEQILSKGPIMFIKVRENRPPSLRYVWLEYRQLRQCTPQMVLLQSEMTPQTLHSDFSLQNINGTFRPTNHYPNNMHCQWLIAPQSNRDFVRVHVQNSSVNTYQDSVSAYDYQSGYGGIGHLLSWTGSQTPTILSARGHSVLLEFITNEKFTDKGFTLDYSSIKDLNGCPSMALLIAGDQDQYLSSPNPSNYTSDMDCKWRITSTTGVVELTLLSLSINQGDDGCLPNNSLVIYDGPTIGGHSLAGLCGHSQTQRTFYSYSQTLLVHFRAKQSASSTSFQMRYKTLTDPDFWNCNRHIVLTENEDQVIASPLYPNPYPGYVSCYWRVEVPVTRIMLEVIYLDVPQSSPVLLYDGDTANSHMLARMYSYMYQRQYLSSQQFMFIIFSSSSNYGFTGFQFRLHSLEDNEACYGKVENLTAYRDKQYITSPGYPGHYPPNSDCQWRILSSNSYMLLYVEIEDAKVESTGNCSFDSVTFYNGNGKGSPQLGIFCGEEQVSYNTQGDYMFISFISSAYVQYRGFRMAYWVGPAVIHTTSAPGSGASHDDNTTAKIVGGVMAGIVFIVGGAAAFFIFNARRKRRLARS